MPSLTSELIKRFQAVTPVDPELRPATKPQFGHYQSNLALRLANERGLPPRVIAQELVAQLDLAGLCEPVEIAGPGFLNLRLTPAALAAAASAVLADPQLGVVASAAPQRVVIDYSGPNVAKQMHVGHLRSTIIGDCFRRVFTALGHQVIAQNHIGDWGTQFGQLLEAIMESQIDSAQLTIAEADALYVAAAARYREDADFAARARQRVVHLQAGDPASRQIWGDLIKISTAAFNSAYQRLDVLLTDADLAGESTYNSELAKLVADLVERDIAVLDDGALCIFVPGFSAPLIIRKRDGGYNYDTTDLAAVRHRVAQLQANRIIYVTDLRQSDHFEMIFAAARRAGYLPDAVTTQFVGFGMVLGPDGKPFKTRAGSTVTLNSLLDEAEAEVAPEVALAAIKYADLSNALNKDYVFDPERMTKTIGDTGPYLQYAHARVQQLLRRAAAQQVAVSTKITTAVEPAEQQLALALTRYGEVVAEVAETLQPHRLCTYLYETAQAFSVFYEQCPVLTGPEELRGSRLALSAATGRVLAAGLYLLGIRAPDRM